MKKEFKIEFSIESENDKYEILFDIDAFNSIENRIYVLYNSVLILLNSNDMLSTRVGISEEVRKHVFEENNRSIAHLKMSLNSLIEYYKETENISIQIDNILNK